MNDRERQKLRAVDIINIILKVPDSSTPFVAELSLKIDGLINTVNLLDARCNNNAAEIIVLKETNKLLNERNDTLEQDKVKLNELTSQVASIDQYLRINNVEIVGLPDLNEGDDEEMLILEALNALEPPTRITSNDIDISHILPTNRKDNKKVHVCRFVSRKTKNMIVTAKKAKRDFKYRGNLIFINEHLSPLNRRLFDIAKSKQKLLNYKFLWTRNGYVYMRHNEVPKCSELQVRKC